MKIRDKVGVVVRVSLSIAIALWWLSGMTTAAWALPAPHLSRLPRRLPPATSTGMALPTWQLGSLLPLLDSLRLRPVQYEFGTARRAAWSAGKQVWHQDSPGVRETAEPYDWFGASVAAGDFNGDGFADLAVGALLETLGAAQCGGRRAYLVWLSQRVNGKRPIKCSIRTALACRRLLKGARGSAGH